MTLQALLSTRCQSPNSDHVSLGFLFSTTSPWWPTGCVWGELQYSVLVSFLVLVLSFGERRTLSGEYDRRLFWTVHGLRFPLYKFPKSRLVPLRLVSSHVNLNFLFWNSWLCPSLDGRRRSTSGKIIVLLENTTSLDGLYVGGHNSMNPSNNFTFINPSLS